MALSDPKYFHISDILSFTSGKTLSFDEQLTAPDGSVRPKPETSLANILDLAGHIKGESFWINTKTHEYDGTALGFSLPDLRASIVAQLPWLKDYPKSAVPSAPADASAEEKNEFYNGWVKSVAAKVGGEWFTVQTGMPEPEAATKPQAKATPFALR